MKALVGAFNQEKALVVAFSVIVQVVVEPMDRFTALIESTSMEQYDRVMNTNMRAVYQLTMMAVPHLTLTRGNIVNVSSVNGIRSFPGKCQYCQ